MTLIAREVIERSNMYITNVPKNITGALSPIHQAMKDQKEVRGLSNVPKLLFESQEQKLKISNNMPENFIGLFRSGQNHWHQFLQACDCKLNVERENIDISECIKDVCETSDKLLAESLLAEKTSCIYQMKDGKELSYLTFYQMCRKTSCFSYGDIRHVHRIYASN